MLYYNISYLSLHYRNATVYLLKWKQTYKVCHYHISIEKFEPEQGLELAPPG